MKKTIAIICDFCTISPNGINDGIGGSETWVIEISKQFAKNDYYVIVFSQNQIWSTFEYNIEYIPVQKLESIISHVKIDYTFIFRYIWQDTINILQKYINNKKVFWVCHDTDCYIDNKTITTEKFENDNWLKDNINKFICMSNFCKECIQNHIQLSNDKFIVIGNGIDFDLIEYNNIEKDNNFFWSSRWERGLDLFANKILPKIHEKHPESKIYVAQYNGSLPEEFINNKDIVFLGKLSKKDLYIEMQKHKVYFYPNFYPETFCITILEAILCDNELITTYNHGITTTLSFFKDILLDPIMDFNNEENKMIANKIIDSLDNYNNIDRQHIRNIMKTYIKENYSWENIYKQFKNYILI